MAEESQDLNSILSNRKVLLVEDNEINQELMQEILNEEGMQVVTASDGAEALEILSEENNIDCVLMDCLMPIMDGYEATRQIREQEKYKDLPIIAMTGNSMASDRKQALDVGMNDYIAKPIDYIAMFDIMAKWVSKS